MPPKRRARGSATASNDQQEDGKPKKRRVSLACDACRAAREKCDGGRPECGTCVAQNRSCSYTPATKKRGVQTGYLRTIELSLAWLFDQMPECEESLNQFLAKGDANKDTRALLGKGSSGHRLQRLWNHNRVRKAIDGLLSDSQIPNSENSGNESDSDVERQTITRDAGTSFGPGGSMATGAFQEPARLSDRILKLPSNWKQLLDVYVSYTHCWLPIVNPEDLRSVAASYPRHGISIHDSVSDTAYSGHSELWAALAIASFQYDEYLDSEDAASLSSSQIFRVSRSIIPPDDGVFDIHSINAVIIHAVILIGRGKVFAASLLLSKSARLLRQRQSAASDISQDENEFSSIQQHVASLACSFLDVLTSVYLNQYPMLECNGIEPTISSFMAEFDGFDQPWHPAPPKSSTQSTSTTSQPMAQPIRTLFQLHAFTSLMGDHLNSQLKGELAPVMPGPESLVQKLDHRFNFCNSFISSGTTPALPSAYFVKLLFLTATIELTPDIRSSLLSGFLEIIESCFAIFGARNTPPVVLLLLQLVQRRAKIDDMGEFEQRKWRSAVESLQNIWPDSTHSADTPYEVPAASDRLAQPNDLQQITFTPMSAVSDPYVESQGHARSQSGAFGLNPLTGNKPTTQYRFGYQDAIPNPAFTIDSPLTTHPNIGRVNTHTMFPGNHRMSQNFDYDTIFEDLGSIGYGDNLEMDSRFMTNLGFAPGCDLAEIFQGDFGV